MPGVSSVMLHTRAGVTCCCRLCRGVGGFSATENGDSKPAAGAFSKLLTRIGLSSEPSDGQVRLTSPEQLC